MEYHKVEPSQFASSTPTVITKVTAIWANDGWCYIPQLNIRRKFTETHYLKEDWDGVIAMPEYVETITWKEFPDGVWQENEEAFQLKSSSPCNHMKPKSQRVRRQQPRLP